MIEADDISESEAEKEAHEADQLRKRKARALYENNTIAEQMHTYKGRAFVWMVLAECGIYHENHCGDSLQMAKHEGTRAVGLRLTQKVLTVTPERYNQMREEAVLREKEWK